MPLSEVQEGKLTDQWHQEQCDCLAKTTCDHQWEVDWQIISLDRGPNTRPEDHGEAEAPERTTEGQVQHEQT